MLTEFVYFAGAIWLISVAMVATPRTFYSTVLNRITKDKYRTDTTQIRIMIDHLRNNPELWSVNREMASFPADSKAKQIYLTYDERSGWGYNLNGFGNTKKPLDGYYGRELTSLIDYENEQREARSLLKNFYPEINSQLLLAQLK